MGYEIGKTGHDAPRHFILRKCNICGNSKWVRIEDVRKTCSKCAIKINNKKYLQKYHFQPSRYNPRWKGGIVKDGSGYKGIKIYSDNPFYSMAKKSGYVYEHRLVMARHLGRPLERKEIVHHVDGNRENNKLPNLELTKHRKGFHHMSYQDGYKRGYQDGLKSIMVNFNDTLQIRRRIHQ